MTPSNVRRTVVVAAASRHGATAEIADRVATRLCALLPAHWSVCRSDPGNAWSLADADAVVLGSAIYFGRWLRPARQALQRLDDQEHVWLFSSGPVSLVAADNEQLIKEDERIAGLQAHPHATFGGCLDARRLSRIERLVTRLVRADAGDHRDWAAIDAWADGIADELHRIFEVHHLDGADADRAVLHTTGARP